MIGKVYCALPEAHQMDLLQWSIWSCVGLFILSDPKLCIQKKSSNSLKNGKFKIQTISHAYFSIAQCWFLSRYLCALCLYVRLLCVYFCVGCSAFSQIQHILYCRIIAWIHNDFVDLGCVHFFFESLQEVKHVVFYPARFIENWEVVMF